MLTEKELGERLKNVRKMRNISQFRMADMMGTEQSFIAKLERARAIRRCRRYIDTPNALA